MSAAYEDLDATIIDGLAPEDADLLDDLPDDGQVEGLRERFRIADDAQAEWAMRKLARLARQRRSAESVAQAEYARIEAWLEDEAGKVDRQAEFFEGLLADYHRQVLDDDPKRKTVSLPSGELKARKARGSVKLDDELFVKWAGDHAADLVEYVAKVSKADVKKRFQVGEADADGVAPLVDPDTGEVVPGVQVVFGGVPVGSERVEFTAKPEGDR